MFTKESLEALEKAEREFQFEKFNLQDARALGDLLFSQSKFEAKPIACRIILDDLIVYQSFNFGTGANNNWWMDRKCRTVLRTHGSSLKALVKRELFGVTSPWMSNEDTYAFCGGGFPLIVKGEFRGVICISGLPHLEDHRCVTEVIASYLGKEPILIPVEK